MSMKMLKGKPFDPYLEWIKSPVSVSKRRAMIGDPKPTCPTALAALNMSVMTTEDEIEFISFLQEILNTFNVDYELYEIQGNQQDFTFSLFLKFDGPARYF